MTPAQIAEAQKLAREWKPRQKKRPPVTSARNFSEKLKNFRH